MSAIVSTVSRPGLAFIAGHEGRVLKAYLCPAGVVTIGYGFTMGSQIFAQWWRAKHGRALRLGDTMLLADADMLLEKIVNEEYGRVVVQKIKPRRQHHYDAAASMTFNCGTGAADWRWAQALARGDVAESARLLRVTATTGGGKQLPGLVRRRAEEAHLLETGEYGKAAQAALTPADEVRDRLARIGFTGVTAIEAVRAFQKARGLTVDGLVGPATRAALVRAEEARLQGQQSAAGGATGGVATGTVEHGEGIAADPSTIVDALPSVGMGVLVVGGLILAGWLIWRFRGLLFAALPDGVKDFAQYRLGITIGRRVIVPA